MSEEAARDVHPLTASELPRAANAMKGFNMKQLSDNSGNYNSHHRPFLGPDGTVRINNPAGGWRFATRAKAVLGAPNIRRLQRYREEG